MLSVQYEKTERNGMQKHKSLIRKKDMSNDFKKY